jgi:hypothetical protein
MEITAMKTRTARFGRMYLRSLALAVALFVMPAISSAAVFLSVDIAPPALPVYVQPEVPGPGYIWAPGYWAYGPDGYYWVPGTWVLAPYVGALWTPGYWGWGGAAYLWHGGYWGPHVGFYGGVNYGFGYIGTGYVGGSWNGGVFNYNTAVTNVNVTNIHNTYNQTVVQNTAVSRVSYNGGTGGITAQPTAQERLAQADVHQPPTPLQAQHQQLASSNRSLLASVNHGTPALAATPKAAVFTRPNTSTSGVAHPPNTGNAAVAHPNTGNAAVAHPPNTGQPRNAVASQSTYHGQGQGQGQTQITPHPQVQQRVVQPGTPHPQVQQHTVQAAPPHPQVQQNAVQAAPPHPQVQSHPKEPPHEEGHH